MKFYASVGILVEAVNIVEAAVAVQQAIGLVERGEVRINQLAAADKYTLEGWDPNKTGEGDTDAGI